MTTAATASEVTQSGGIISSGSFFPLIYITIYFVLPCCVFDMLTEMQRDLFFYDWPFVLRRRANLVPGNLLLLLFFLSSLTSRSFPLLSASNEYDSAQGNHQLLRSFISSFPSCNRHMRLTRVTRIRRTHSNCRKHEIAPILLLVVSYLP